MTIARRNRKLRELAQDAHHSSIEAHGEPVEAVLAWEFITQVEELDEWIGKPVGSRLETDTGDSNGRCGWYGSELLMTTRLPVPGECPYCAAVYLNGMRVRCPYEHGTVTAVSVVTLMDDEMVRRTTR